jgi:hypothetical protein
MYTHPKHRVQHLVLLGMAFLLVNVSYADEADKARAHRDAHIRRRVAEIHAKHMVADKGDISYRDHCIYLLNEHGQRMENVRKLVTRLGELIREKERKNAEMVAAVAELEALVADEGKKTKKKLRDLHDGITHWNYKPMKEKASDPGSGVSADKE